MTAYLTRLVTRGSAIGASQSLRPFVRSASPIAEYDQRLGASTGEGFDPGELSPNSGQAMSGGGEAFHQAPPPGMTTHDESGAAVQRKAFGSLASMASPAVQVASSLSAAGTTKQHENEYASGAAGGTALHLPLASDVRARARPFVMSHGGVGDPDAGSYAQSEWPPTDIPLTDGYRSPYKSSEARDGSWKADNLEISSFDERWRGRSTVHSGTDSVRMPADQPLRQPGMLDPKRPERTNMAPAPLYEESHRTGRRTDDSPHVMIGRINVEVVPPPEAQQPSPPSPAGPLTAASASVIGPLGRRSRPNLRLSLRHR